MIEYKRSRTNQAMVSVLLKIILDMPSKHPKPPQPIHISGTTKGEEMVIHKGKEAGRDQAPHSRWARDSTGINAKAKDPISPLMPHIPPA